MTVGAAAALLATLLVAAALPVAAQETLGAGAGERGSVVLRVALPEPPPLTPAPPIRSLARRPAVSLPPAAQPPARERGAWQRGVELSANVFVGNRPQSVVTTRGRLSHADSTIEFGADLRFSYGEATVDDERQVSQRLWFGTVTLDLWPFASNSPFLLGTVESSLERRIRLRTSGGIGHKLTFVDDERALANFSLAILGERSRLLTAQGDEREETLARFSARLRLRRSLGERAAVGLETFFRPEYANLQRYTLSNGLTGAYRLNDLVNVRLSYLDNYDTEARRRGARSNYDGQLVVGLAAEW